MTKEIKTYERTWFKKEWWIKLNDHNQFIYQQKNDYEHIIKSLEYRIKKLKEGK